MFPLNEAFGQTFYELLVFMLMKRILYLYFHFCGIFVVETCHEHKFILSGIWAFFPHREWLFCRLDKEKMFIEMTTKILCHTEY